MKKFITIPLLFLLIQSYAQVKKNDIFKSILSSDSIVIVSHLLTYGPKVVSEKTGKVTKQKFLVVNNILNKAIIKEYVKLDNKEIDKLIKILNIPETDSEKNKIKCFLPHHGILLFKNKRISYIDLCFQCLNFATSKDINNDFNFSTKAWEELVIFFKSKKITYKLPE